MSANGISTLATKELRQKAKLDLAASDRAASGEARATYDITQLPTQYNDNAIINNPNTGGLVVGRPWITTVGNFTFFEAFGTTTTISTTQYVSGNKIYAESSTYDVSIPAPPARVVVNDIQVLSQGDTPNPAGRGHNLVVLDSYGNVVTAATQYDTWDTVGSPGASTALASALGAVASGNIVVLVAYDASAVTAGVRTAINTGYGSTNSNTWVSERRSHIFIGIKI
jgi:Interleukin-like EMT inducer